MRNYCSIVGQSSKAFVDHWLAASAHLVTIPDTARISCNVLASLLWLFCFVVVRFLLSFVLGCLVYLGAWFLFHHQKLLIEVVKIKIYWLANLLGINFPSCWIQFTHWHQAYSCC
jgi:hypothetical protein